MQGTIARNGSFYPRGYRFAVLWLLSYLTGAALGVALAGRSAADLPDVSVSLCEMAGCRLTALGLFCSAAGFMVLTMLLSLLPCGSALVFMLTAGKAMCSAYVLGLFYQFRQTLSLDAAMLHLLLHTVLFTPVFYTLASRCCQGKCGKVGDGIPLALPFLGLLILTLLEQLVRRVGLM